MVECPAQPIAQIDTAIRSVFSLILVSPTPLPNPKAEEGPVLEQARKTTRRRSRIRLTLQFASAIGESGHQWIEQSRLVDVSHFGAVLLRRDRSNLDVLILLSIPLPDQFAVSNHAEPQYSVWSLVRHASRHQKRRRHPQSALFPSALLSWGSGA